MKSYPAYIPSGIEWVGDVPAHWEHRKLRSILHRTNERHRHDLPLLSVVRERGVIPRDVTYSDDNHNVIPEDLSNYKVVRKGQFAMNKMKAWQGSYGVSEHTGIVSPAYFTFDIDGVTGEFLHVALRSKAYVPFFTAGSDGVRIAQWDLSPTQMREIPLWIPPLPEQRAIARYLDYMDSRIQRYIRAKERLIELLEEQKRAVINQAVTRGLDPDVPLKSSGVEWLGDVPAHWEVTRVKNEFTNLNARRIPLSSVERGEMSQKIYDYYGASGVIDRVDDYLFDDELLLIAEDGANLVGRNLPLAIIARGKFWVNNHAHILKSKRGNLEYLAAVMESLSYMPWISGAAQPKLTQDRLMNIAIAVPARQEQERVLAVIGPQISEIQRLVGNGHRQIELVKEYRTRLIADVVTGKLDVRDAAEGLADELSEEELLEPGGDLESLEAANIG